MASISVVIPVYNAETTVGMLCEELLAKMPDLTDSFEIVLVED